MEGFETYINQKVVDFNMDLATYAGIHLISCRRGGECYRYKFENGYGASVISTITSYGGKQGLYELMVLKHDQPCYYTPITDDVVGYLTVQEVIELLQEIQRLKR